MHILSFGVSLRTHKTHHGSKLTLITNLLFLAHRGVKRLLKELPGPRRGKKEDTIYNVRALFLKSMPLWIQIYIPLVYIIELLFSQNRIRSNKTKRHYWFLSRNLNLAWRALACHKSQFVWYRMLSILFSRYTYINVLVEE
jgi:hypothetical protein